MAKKRELTGHWKKQYDKNYIGSWSIEDGQEPLLTIAKLGRKEVKSDRETEECFVIWFKESINDENLPMIINSTNAEFIGNLYGHNIEGWVGNQVELYIDHNVKAFGSIVDGLRFRAPTVKPILTPNGKKWDVAQKRAAEGMTIRSMRKHYQITDENFKLLTAK